MIVKVAVTSLIPGDVFTNHLGTECTVVSVSEQYPSVDGYDYHCMKGNKVKLTYTCKLPAWDELQVYTLAFWAETLFEVVNKMTVKVENVNEVYTSASGLIEGRLTMKGFKWAIETRAVQGNWKIDSYHHSAYDAAEVLQTMLNDL